MSTTKHTAEPWEAQTEHGAEIFGADRRIIAIIDSPHRSDEEDAANAAHIVKCVTACAGMEDPAKALEMLRMLADATRRHPSSTPPLVHFADTVLRALGGQLNLAHGPAPIILPPHDRRR